MASDLTRGEPIMMLGTLALGILYGCSGDHAAPTPPPTPSKPVITFAIAPSQIVLGAASVATWTATDARSCAAENAWSGPRNPTGSETLTPATVGTFTYTLGCTGPGGTVSASAALTVTTPPTPPTVTITATPDTIFVGQSIRLTWSSSNSTSCTATGAWSGSQTSIGSVTVTPTGPGKAGFVLTCTGAGGTATATATVVANVGTLSLAETFSPNGVTIPTSEGAPYGEGDAWYKTVTVDARYGYGPTKVLRLYICLNGPVHYFDCSTLPPPAGALPPQTLVAIDAGIAAYAHTGTRLLIRFNYNFGGDGAQDEPATTIASHIDQLAPVLLKNRDLILAIEAGFIGQWGEWHHSTNGNDTPAAHKIVLDKELSYFRNIFPVLVRYPKDILDYTGSATPDPAIGLYDDYYDSPNNGGGTFIPSGSYSTAQLQAYTAALSNSSMLVGEFGELDKTRHTCAAVDAFSFAYHPQSISLNISPPTIGDYLVSQGCATSMFNKAGVRIVLQSATLLGEARPGGRVHAALTLVNDGYGRVLRQRPAFVMLSSGGRTVATIPIPASSLDVRSLPSSATPAPATFEFNFTLPASLPPGTISAALYFADAAPSLADDPAYALPMNSTDRNGRPVFDASTGRHLVAHSSSRERRRRGANRDSQICNYNLLIDRRGFASPTNPASVSAPNSSRLRHFAEAYHPRPRRRPPRALRPGHLTDVEADDLIRNARFARS